METSRRSPGDEVEKERGGRRGDEGKKERNKRKGDNKKGKRKMNGNINTENMAKLEGSKQTKRERERNKKQQWRNSGKAGRGAAETEVSTKEERKSGGPSSPANWQKRKSGPRACLSFDISIADLARSQNGKAKRKTGGRGMALSRVTAVPAVRSPQLSHSTPTFSPFSGPDPAL